MAERSRKSNELNRPIEIGDAQLAKFWGADLAELTAYQKTLIAQLFQTIELRRRQ